MGVHPCRAQEPFKDYQNDLAQDPTLGVELPAKEIVERYIGKIDKMLSTAERKDKFVAIGECGLDYDRFEYADKETQLL